MPNNPRLAMCPYYLNHHRAAIVCEDVRHSFDDSKDREDWMNTYCRKMTWDTCPYASALNDLYEKGDDEALERHKNDTREKEINSLATKIGKLEKKVKDLEDENAGLKRQNDRAKRDRKRWRDQQSTWEKQEVSIRKQLALLTEVYECRMAYLIDQFEPDKKLHEADVEAWAKDKSFAIVHEDTDRGIAWKVIFEEKEKKRGKNKKSGDSSKSDKPSEQQE